MSKPHNCEGRYCTAPEHAMSCATLPWSWDLRTEQLVHPKADPPWLKAPTPLCAPSGPSVAEEGRDCEHGRVRIFCELCAALATIEALRVRAEKAEALADLNFAQASDLGRQFREQLARAEALEEALECVADDLDGRVMIQGEGPSWEKSIRKFVRAALSAPDSGGAE